MELTSYEQRAIEIIAGKLSYSIKTVRSDYTCPSGSDEMATQLAVCQTARLLEAEELLSKAAIYDTPELQENIVKFLRGPR